MATKRTGRPPKDPAPDDLVTLGLQVSGAIKIQLLARAKAANRSISQEVTMILEEALEPPLLRLKREFGTVGGTWAFTLGLMFQTLQRSAENGINPLFLAGYVSTWLKDLQVSADALAKGEEAKALSLALHPPATLKAIRSAKERETTK